MTRESGGPDPGIGGWGRSVPHESAFVPIRKTRPVRSCAAFGGRTEHIEAVSTLGAWTGRAASGSPP